MVAAGWAVQVHLILRCTRKAVIVEKGELVEIKHDEPNVGHLHKRLRKAP